MANETHEQLLERAAMNQYQDNTNIVYSTDKVARIGVSSAWHVKWGDCVGLSWMMEGEPYWHVANFSPARARLIAQKLLRYADNLEASGNPGLTKIDSND